MALTRSLPVKAGMPGLALLKVMTSPVLEFVKLPPAELMLYWSLFLADPPVVVTMSEDLLREFRVLAELSGVVSISLKTVFKAERSKLLKTYLVLQF